MAGFKSLVAGVIGALACCVSAYAADMPGNWPLPTPELPHYSELMSGWYIRLDAGYSWNRVGAVASQTPVTGTDYRNSPDVTFGAGVKYQWLRFEATIDRGFPSTFGATTGLGTAQQPQYTAKLGWLAALGSVYFDLGSWSGFTPYVGAGAGAARLHSTNYTDNGLPPHGTSPPSQKSNFAWAAMAGVAYQVSPRVVVDLGYRFLDLGDVPNTTGTNLPVDNMTIKSVTAQQVRLGVRFLLD